MRPVTDNMVMVGGILLRHAGSGQTQRVVIVQHDQIFPTYGTYPGGVKNPAQTGFPQQLQGLRGKITVSMLSAGAKFVVQGDGE